MVRCDLTEEVFVELASLLKSGSSPLKYLSVGLNKVGDQGVHYLWEALRHPSCELEELELVKYCIIHIVLWSKLTLYYTQNTLTLKPILIYFSSVEMTNMTDASVEDMCAAIKASKTLKRLELRNNLLTNVSVPSLIRVMQESPNMKEIK